jgi:hypothetical protein
MEYSKSVKKFIRTQKAQIRRGTRGVFLDAKKQEELIKEMYNKLNLVK